MKTTREEILFEFAKKLAEVPIPEVPMNLEPISIDPEPKQEEKHPAGSPEWLAQNYGREFVTRTERGKPNWVNPRYDELAQSTLKRMLEDTPESFFFWNLGKQQRFNDYENIAAEKYIDKDPAGAILNKNFFTRLLVGGISVDLAQKLWENIVEKYNPMMWKNKQQGMFYTRFKKLTDYIEEKTGQPPAYSSTKPIELETSDIDPTTSPEWIGENYPRVLFKDKAWQDKASKRGPLGEQIKGVRGDVAMDIAVEDPKKYFNWEIHRAKGLSDAKDTMHPTAIAASNLIDKDPIAALLNKNFFGPMISAEKVDGLRHGQLSLLWNKLIDNTITQDKDGNNVINFTNPVINDWFNNPPSTTGTQEDIIGSQLGRLAKHLGKVAGGDDDVRALFNRTPETLKMVGPDTEQETIWMDKIRESVKTRTKMDKDRDRKREDRARKKRMSKRDK